MQAARNLIKELGRHIGLDSLELDESGQCTLAFDETIVLTFVGDMDDGLNVVSYIGDLESNHHGVACKLLAQNFVPNGLGGGRVAMEPDSDRVVLVHRWDGMRTDFGSFTANLESFVNAVESVRAELEAGASAGTTSSTAVDSPKRGRDLPPPGSFA
jgi:hypothetical protein